jgi:sRNA-binding carbon storage regulator CsrA
MVKEGGRGVGLTYRLKPGDSVQIGDDVTITVREDSRNNKHWVQIDAPRAVPISVQKTGKQLPVDGAC